jgi:pyruvyltransferase
MAIKTYYWDQRNVSFLKYVKNKILNKEQHYFRYGNTGDIFNVNLIKKLYNTNAVNKHDEAGRLFLLNPR